MSIINVTNLTFSYPSSYENIFTDVSFRIDTDWKLGFTGRNGRGKTTFLNLLLGRYEYQGSITASVDFEYFPFEIENSDWLTADIAESILPNFLNWELVRELNKLKVDEEILYRPFNTLSKGEQTKVMLAILFLKENSFLLIDEPTNHLDMQGRKTVSKYLNSKKGFILVSHDRDFLDECIDHIMSINRSDIEIQKGNFSSWITNRERQDEFEKNENSKLKKEINRLEKSVKRTEKWSDAIEKSKYGDGSADRGYIGHQSARMMKRSKAIENRRLRAIEETTSLLKNIERTDELKIHSLNYRSNRLLMLKDVAVKYGEKTVCENISFTVERGDRIALFGKNGSGKSSILKLIRSEPINFSGILEKGNDLKISYVSQDVSLPGCNLSDFAKDNKIDESLFKTILIKLGFSREQFDKNINDFSMGQKKKVIIAKSLSEEAHLYIWDEPMNYIDVISRIQIENLILQYKPTMIFVEHDKAFCEKTANKKIYIGE